MRYFRLMTHLARFALAREMSFRGNFLAKVLVEIIWLGIMLAFYQVVFTRTKFIAGWDEAQYLFFVGCFFAVNGIIEMFFLDNCNEFSELIRTGDLDFLLIKPIDEQFMITCRKMDWGVAPNVLMGAGLMIFALQKLHWEFHLGQILGFFSLFGCGVLLCYSFMLLMTSSSVWLVRNQSVMELWWLCTNLARYPKEIFKSTWAEPFGVFFTFILPFLLVINIPASIMVRSLEPGLIGFEVVASLVLFFVSRWFFLWSLKSYRSASS